ncbi:MAG: inorganic diphosphatase [Clostridia bacterium]|nr:inorganic diphosphatase [Clostridia bacterium]
MNIWHDLSKDRINPEDFISCIEIPKGCKNKYEVDKQTGMLILDRILYTATHYPANYGFIPRTYADDADPLDVLVICSEEIAPLALVRCYPIGQIAMIDEGREDIKILAVPFKDPNWNGYKDVNELPPHIIDEMKHFFGVYKQLEGKKMEVLELSGREVAVESITKAIKLYEEVFLKD